MRITINNDNALVFQSVMATVLKYHKDDFLKMISFSDGSEMVEATMDDILKSISEELVKPIKTTKRNATKKATIAKVASSKRILENTVNLMRLEGKKLNVSTVSRESGLAYNTVKKYRSLFVE